MMVNRSGLLKYGSQRAVCKLGARKGTQLLFQKLQL